MANIILLLYFSFLNDKINHLFEDFPLTPKEEKEEEEEEEKEEEKEEEEEEEEKEEEVRRFK